MPSQLTNLRFFQELLRAAKRQIREVQGAEPADLKRYYRTYALEIESSHPVSCEEDDFLRAVARAEVVLVGDFHALDQAQKQFLRVLQSLLGKGIKPIVALEMVEARHEPELQEYMSGSLEDGDFLLESKYFENWGFDFNHYRPILEFIRSEGLEVHGINRQGSLRERDRSMALRISELRRDKTGIGPVLVLVGDLHLARPHLPAELKGRGYEPLVLFQNSETVIMRALKRGHPAVGWWRLGDGRFLVNNTAPWIKMQAYLTWLEHGGEALCSMYGYCKGLEGSDSEVDLTETLQQYIRILKNLFDLRTRSDDDYQVFTLNDLDFLENPYFRSEPGKTYARIIRDGRPLFMAWLNTIYIPILDVNRTAQEAAHFLMGRSLNIDYGRMAFHDRIHYFASGYAASKLLNPLRKAETERDLRDLIARYEGLMGGKEKRYLRRRYEAARCALKFIRRVREGRELPSAYITDVTSADRQSNFLVAEILGKALGERLYQRYDRGELSGWDLKQYIFTQRNPFHFGLAGP